MSSEFETVAAVIRRRQTTKVIGPVADLWSFDPAVIARHDQLVRDAVAHAGWAPFHFDRGVDSVPEPWRIHLLWHSACRQLADELPRLVEVPPQNRQRGLLSGCGATILVNWLPVSGLADAAKQKTVNEEHLAAAAAFAQNLLLLLEAAGMENYWASPGLLGHPAVRQRIGITAAEEIAAVVFAGYPRPKDAAAELLGGKNRSVRTPMQNWTAELRNLP